MSSGYTILFTIEQLQGLSQDTKAELAMLFPEFAKICGVATEANPAPVPTTKGRSRKKTADGGQAVEPVMNQPNQQSAVDPAISAYLPQAAASFAAAPPNMAPVVPSSVPPFAGVPPQNFQPPQVVNPMPQGQTPPWQPHQPDPANNPSLTVHTPPLVPNPQPPQQQQQPWVPPQQPVAPPQPTTPVIPNVGAAQATSRLTQIFEASGQNVPYLARLFATAQEKGILAGPNAQFINDSNAPAFAAHVNSFTEQQWF